MQRLTKTWRLLLRNDFTAHYGLPVSTTATISVNTNDVYFEIEDDAHREIQIHALDGSGMAAYQNINGYDVTIINYDKFITGLPSLFQNGIKRCDLIVHTANQNYFLLNELKDRKPKSKVRNKSISQLLASLTMIMNVPAIITFANLHAVRQCCFFNKQSMAPPLISATTAFNRLSTAVTTGLRMPNPSIEAFGFEFWEYSGNQVYRL
ncbi:hypothetical protein Dfri01_20350 [Dyadobacter frigoris]|nr:hypothetical protein Dfri01_20350 [Dyadobacter frigoris]